MPPPKLPTAYPVEFRAALTRAISSGELFIPHEKPAAFRLQFYGFISALRRSGEPELAEACSFFVQKDPPGLWIRLKEQTPTAKLIRDAMGEKKEETSPSLPASDSEIDALFNRIIGG